MTHCFRKVCSIVLFSLSLLPASYSLADDGKSLFVKQCASCHTVGGGDEGGPDLKGVTGKRSDAWLVRVIAEPDKLAADNDPIQLGLVKKYGYEMPNLGVSRDNAKLLVAYLKTTGGVAVGQATAGKDSVKEANKGAAGESIVTVPAQVTPVEGASVKSPELVVTPELIAAGLALFSGEKRFVNGGAPCGACHGFGYPGLQSGNLAADLSTIYERMGEQGMRGVLKALKFPTMKKIYADKPLSDEEIVALIVFARDGAVRKVPATGGSFPATGVVLLIGAIVILTVYQRRSR